MLYSDIKLIFVASNVSSHIIILFNPSKNSIWIKFRMENKTDFLEPWSVDVPVDVPSASIARNKTIY